MSQPPTEQQQGYDPSDVTTRHRIRTGTHDTWKQDVYKKSKSGAYDEASDPNRIKNRLIEPIDTDGRLDYHDRISRRGELVDQMGQQQNQYAAQIAWTKERERQEAAYAAYSAEAQSVGGTPYYMGNSKGQGSMYIQNLDVSDTGEMRTQIIRAAESMLGHRYSWGGGGSGGPSTGTNRPGKQGGANLVGFDCSGLVQFAFASVGISLPRVSRQQTQMGQVSSISNLKPGDLVGWGRTPSTAHHIAIYLGNGRIIESGTGFGQHQGVRVRALTSSSFDRQAFGVRLGI